MRVALELDIYLPDWNDDAQKFKNFLTEKFGQDTVVVNQATHPGMGTEIFVVLARESCLEQFFKCFTQGGGETFEEWLEYSQVELRLEPMIMSWHDEDDDVFFSMNVWLHEPSGIAFADKKGTIRVSDLDIEVPAHEIAEEKFEPRRTR